MERGLGTGNLWGRVSSPWSWSSLNVIPLLPPFGVCNKFSTCLPLCKRSHRQPQNKGTRLHFKKALFVQTNSSPCFLPASTPVVSTGHDTGSLHTAIMIEPCQLLVTRTLANDFSLSLHFFVYKAKSSAKMSFGPPLGVNWAKNIPELIFYQKSLGL